MFDDILKVLHLWQKMISTASDIMKIMDTNSTLYDCINNKYGSVVYDGTENLHKVFRKTEGTKYVTFRRTRKILFDAFIIRLGAIEFDEYPHDVRYTRIIPSSTFKYSTPYDIPEEDIFQKSTIYGDYELLMHYICNLAGDSEYQCYVDFRLDGESDDAECLLQYITEATASLEKFKLEIQGKHNDSVTR